MGAKVIIFAKSLILKGLRHSAMERVRDNEILKCLSSLRGIAAVAFAGFHKIMQKMQFDATRGGFKLAD